MEAGCVLQRSLIEKKIKMETAIGGGNTRTERKKNGQHPSRQHDINSLLTEPLDFGDASNFLKSGKLKAKAGAFVHKLVVRCKIKTKDV